MLDDDDDDEPYKYKKHQRKNEFGENFLFGGLEIKTHRVQYKGYIVTALAVNILFYEVSNILTILVL